MSHRAYQRAVTQAETPRELEYRAFGQATAALVRARELQGGETQGGAPAAALAEALDLNRRFWSVLSNDCAAPGNGLPPALRGQIISLALWVGRYSSEVIRGGAEIDPLIEINRLMMEGLSAR